MATCPATSATRRVVGAKSQRDSTARSGDQPRRGGYAFAREQAALSAAVGELPRTLNQGFRTLGVVDQALLPVRARARSRTPAVLTSPATLDASIPLARELRGSSARRSWAASPAHSRSPPRRSHGSPGARIRLQGQQARLARLVPDQRLAAHERGNGAGPGLPRHRAGVPGIREVDASAWPGAPAASTPMQSIPARSRRRPTSPSGWEAGVVQHPATAGHQPAPADPPPLRPTVPCETQEPPDLGSRPLPPPPGIKTQLDAPGEIAAFAAAMKRAQKPLEQAARDASATDAGAAAGCCGAAEPVT